MDWFVCRFYNWGFYTETMGSELFFVIILDIKCDWWFYWYLDRIQDSQIYFIRNPTRRALNKKHMVLFNIKSKRDQVSKA